MLVELLPKSDGIGFGGAGAVIEPPKAVKGFGASTFGVSSTTTDGAADPPNENGGVGAGRGGVAALAIAAPKNEGILGADSDFGNSDFGTSGATTVVTGAGLEKKSAAAVEDAEIAGNARGVETGVRGFGDLIIGITGVGATMGGGVGTIGLIGLASTSIAVGLASPKLNPPAGKTIGGNLIFPRFPSSTGGKSSSLAENTREEATCVLEECDRDGRMEEPAAGTVSKVEAKGGGTSVVGIGTGAGSSSITGTGEALEEALDREGREDSIGTSSSIVLLLSSSLSSFLALPFPLLLLLLFVGDFTLLRLVELSDFTILLVFLLGASTSIRSCSISYSRCLLLSCR